LQVYPEEARTGQLNLMTSHDTPRLITMLGGEAALAALALELLFALPGAPNVYYGDEVGLAGGHDPDNRRAFPWNEALWNREIQRRVAKMARLRRENPELQSADWKPVWSNGRRVVFYRGSMLVTVNAAAAPWFVGEGFPSKDSFRGLIRGLSSVRDCNKENNIELPGYSIEVWVPQRH